MSAASRSSSWKHLQWDSVPPNVMHVTLEAFPSAGVKLTRDLYWHAIQRLDVWSGAVAVGRFRGADL
jgi:hypothetical protein